MSGPRVLWLLALCAAALTVGTAPAAADPYDAQLSSRAFSASFVPTLPFALGEVDLSTLGVPAGALATVGPIGVTSSPGDGPNMYIVDNDRVQCPNAAFTSIQAAVAASGPGDQIKVCPGVYNEQVDISGDVHDGLTLFSQQPLAAVIKAPLVMTEPGDIVRIHGDADDVTLRHFKIAGPLSDTLFCSVETRTGVRIDEDASATLRGNHITEIRSTDPLLRGCQNGIAVRVGRQFQPVAPPAPEPTMPTFGTAWITHNRIDLYQKGAIVVDGTESSARVDHNEIVHGPPDFPVLIAPNGIQVSRGAAGDVNHNVVTQNNGAALGTGIIIFEAGTGEVEIDQNEVFRNDDGISLYDTDNATISHNDSYEQTVWDGLYADSGSAGNTFDHNKAFLNFEHDCHDDSVGPGTAGTANFWIHNKGNTQNRPGLCKS
jgi:parallel beta-helix repeat protein